jgi:hypothetical protein
VKPEPIEEKTTMSETSTEVEPTEVTEPSTKRKVTAAVVTAAVTLTLSVVAQVLISRAAKKVNDQIIPPKEEEETS